MLFDKYFNPSNYWLFLESKYRQMLNARFMSLQWQSPQQLRSAQKVKLYRTLDYAVKHIPYYRRLAGEIDFRYSLSGIFGDLLNFPVLTKNIIRLNHDDLVNPKLLPRSQKNSSGGTTGEPVTVWQSDSSVYAGNLVHLMHLSWAGFKPGEKYLQIWGDEKEIFSLGRSADGIIRLNDHHFILNSFRMSPDFMQKYVNFINTFQPVVIFGYVQSLDLISRYLIRKRQKIFSPRGIFSSAGTLHDHQRRTIETAFSCPVFNKYGSREVHALACECEQHSGLHVDTLAHYIEILDSSNRPVTSEGQTGKIFVTLFDNPVMPLIRYQIGDIAAQSLSICPCGRGFPLVKKILGREVDIFTNSRNEKIDGEYFTHLFYFANFLSQFQVIQEKTDLIKVYYVPLNNKLTAADKRQLTQISAKIKLVMGNSCRIDFLPVSEITPSVSGKYRYTISRITS